MDTKNKTVLTLAAFFLVLGVFGAVSAGSLGKLRIIACDVGQGDGLLVITPGGQDIVIDGGPGSKIADCLSNHMPFWDRTVEMMVLTHPQQDHMEGQLAVFASYKVKSLVTTGVENDTELYREWQKALVAEGSMVYKPVAGDKVEIGDISLEVLWPRDDKYSLWSIAPPADINDTSVVLRLNYAGQCAYFTGDISKEILETVTGKQCAVLKIAHHGSKTGTSEKLLDSIRPKIALIQVGRNNRFGHPHKEVLGMLGGIGVKVLRNDEKGEIELDIGASGTISER